MYDGGKIIAGLVIFLILITFPMWYDVIGGKPDKLPDLKLVTTAKECVRPTAYMRLNHMNLLDQWRDEVVRENIHYVKGIDGKEYEMSLSNTCLGCHPNKSQFCDQCHNYMDVNPYCWDCHNVPKE